MGKADKLVGPRPRGDSTDCVRAEPLVLVVVPTRELAVQVFEDASRIAYRSMLRPVVIYGGSPMKQQLEDIQSGCDILIATPGRLLDFMERPRVLTLSRLLYGTL